LRADMRTSSTSTTRLAFSSTTPDSTNRPVRGDGHEQQHGQDEGCRLVVQASPGHRAELDVLDKRAKLAQAAAVDPKRAVVTLVDPEANHTQGAGSSLEKAA
jgi:hypothetical protein